jgi:hypothetical protein
MANPSGSRSGEEHPRGRGTEHNGGKGKQAADKARDLAANVGEKAREAASGVAEKARDLASNVGQRAEDATAAVGSGMRSLAGTLRETLPHEGVVGSASSTVAGGLESTGRYLQDEGLGGLAQDMTNLIRRNPIPALLLGVGLGFILARATSRN